YLRAAAGTCPGDPEEHTGKIVSNVIEGKLGTVAREMPDGRTIAVTTSTMADGGWVATHEDITDRVRAEAKIKHMARHDALTGLPNRDAFAEKLSAYIDRATKEGGKFAALCIDLDRFKQVNDVFGHAVGDALLREVARRLAAASPRTLLARLGGDEFVILS